MGFSRPALALLLALCPPSSAEDARSIQARLDACAPGEAVAVSGSTRLDYPLILSRDGVSLAGDPKAVLKTTGAFPAVIAGPPIRRYPGFPARHRVPFEGSDGTLTTGLDLSDAAARFRAGAPELILSGKSRGTVACILARKGPTWGQNDQAPVISTDGDRASADSLRLLVAPTRVHLWFRTDDGVERRVAFRREANWPTCRFVGLVDLDAGAVGGYVDGVAVAPDLSAIGDGWRPGLKFAAPRFPDFTVGWDHSAGQGYYALGGLRVCARLTAPISAPGTRLAGTDAFLFGPTAKADDASLDLAAVPRSDDDPTVWYNARGRRGCGILTPAGTLIPGVGTVGAWGPYDTVGELELRDLTIQAGDPDFGSCVEVGVVRNLRLERLAAIGGARGVDCHYRVVSYPLWLSGVRTLNQREVGIGLGRGIVYADGLSFGVGPRQAQLRIHSAGGEIRRFFMPEMLPMEAPITIKAFTGQLAFREGVVNYESAGPGAYFRVGRGQAGPGIKAQLIVDHVEVGNAAPKVAVIDLDDGVWKGRTDGIGSGLVTVRDSFTTVRPSAIARPGSGAWAVETVGGPVAPGTKTTTEPAATPSP